MTRLDIHALQDFLGREEVRNDTVRQAALHQFRDTLEDHLVSDAVSVVPPGFHWTLFQPMVPTSELGPDGHPKSLGLLPELPELSRMWAGGEVSFHAPLQVGADVERRTRVESITEKAGSSGRLLFVSLKHEISAGGQLAISETQTLVYRPIVRSSASHILPAQSTANADFVADSRLLFRYSALTFNTHRIHYDREYARTEEGYPELVVHGPLQATLLMNCVAAKLGTGLFSFSYRGTAPLHAGEPAFIRIAGESAGEVSVQRVSGGVTMQARFFDREGE